MTEKSQVDLHLHSTASDGIYTPAKMVQVSLELGLRFISLTDHDSTDGIQEAMDAAAGTPLTVIPGVEISTDADAANEIHILGYHVERSYGPLQERLTRLRESRSNRAQKVIHLLAKSGVPVSWERVSDLAGTGSIGRPHIAQALVEANHVDSVETAFRRYLGRGAPAYVPRDKLTPQEAIQLIRAAGGIPVLAHPSRVIEHLPALVEAGLAGLEAYYNGYIEPEVTFLVKLADKHGLIATGGTDFHGAGITSVEAPGITFVPLSVVEALQAKVRHTV